VALFVCSNSSATSKQERRRKAKGSGKGGNAAEDCSMFNANSAYNPVTDSCEEDVECTFSEAAPSLEQLITCLSLLLAISMIRAASGLVVTRIYHRELPLTLKFPAWEGPVILVQYLALCESTVSLISLNCSLWLATGLSLFLAFPILLIMLSYTVLRRHILRDHLRFIRFRPFNRTLGQAGLSMGSGCFGKMLACWVTCMQARMRGEWEHDPFGGSALWTFLIGEYVGAFWFYAITRLLKKVVMSAVMGLTDGALNAILCIAVQSVDTACVLISRPHIGRDTDATECLGSIANLLAMIWLGLPVLFPGAQAYFSDVAALFVTLASTLISLVPVLFSVISSLIGVVTSFMSVFGVAQSGLGALFWFLAERSEEEAREQMRRKFARDLKAEQKAVRFQMMVERPSELLTTPQRIKSRGISQRAARKLGVAIAHYECPMVYVRQAIAFVAQVSVYNVTIQHCSGPPISELEEEDFGHDHENRLLAFCMGQHSRLGALCVARGLSDRLLRKCMPPPLSARTGIRDYVLQKNLAASFGAKNQASEKGFFASFGAKNQASEKGAFASFGAKNQASEKGFFASFGAKNQASEKGFFASFGAKNQASEKGVLARVWSEPEGKASGGADARSFSKAWFSQENSFSKEGASQANCFARSLRKNKVVRYMCDMKANSQLHESFFNVKLLTRCLFQEGEKTTTLLDIIVDTDTPERAKETIERLQEVAIRDSLKIHKIPDRVHILTSPKLQIHFLSAGYQLYPPTTTPAAARLQGYCRRMLILCDASNPYTERRQQKNSAAAHIQSCCRRMLVFNDASNPSTGTFVFFRAAHKLSAVKKFFERNYASSKAKGSLLPSTLHDTKQSARNLTYWEIKDKAKGSLLPSTLHDTKQSAHDTKQSARNLTYWEIKDKAKGSLLPSTLHDTKQSLHDTKQSARDTKQSARNLTYWEIKDKAKGSLLPSTLHDTKQSLHDTKQSARNLTYWEIKDKETGSLGKRYKQAYGIDGSDASARVHATVDTSFRRKQSDVENVLFDSPRNMDHLTSFAQPSSSSANDDTSNRAVSNVSSKTMRRNKIAADSSQAMANQHSVAPHLSSYGAIAKPEGFDQFLPQNQMFTSMASRDISTQLLCVVCMDRQKNSRVHPCGHTCVCHTCGMAISNCPICRGPVKRLDRSYI